MAPWPITRNEWFVFKKRTTKGLVRKSEKPGMLEAVKIVNCGTNREEASLHLLGDVSDVV